MNKNLLNHNEILESKEGKMAQIIKNLNNSTVQFFMETYLPINLFITVKKM